MTVDQDDAAVVDLARAQGKVLYLEERCARFEEMMKLATEAQVRAEQRLENTEHDLRQANILADRYEDLMCTIVGLADRLGDIPQELALVVQEARAVARCNEPSV